LEKSRQFIKTKNRQFIVALYRIILSLTFVYFGERAISHERGLMFCILEEIETIAESIVPVMILALPKHTYLKTTPFNLLILIGVLCILRRFKQTSSNQSF